MPTITPLVKIREVAQEAASVAALETEGEEEG